jgi:protein O-GlcNAc transferase
MMFRKVVSYRFSCVSKDADGPGPRGSVGIRGNLTSVHETEREIERGFELHRARNLKAAAEIYRKVLEREPNQPDALYLMGCIAHQSGDSLAAAGLFEKAIAARPEKAEYHNALGTALAQLDKYDLAESNLREAIRLGVRAEFHESLGMLLKAQRRLDESIAEFETAVKLAPGNADAHFNLGNAYQAAGKIGHAITHFELALKLRPGRIPVLAALRLALLAAQRSDDAGALLGEALAARDGHANQLCDLADSLQEAKDFGGAIEVYHRALALDSQMPRGWYACGCAEISREEFVPAIACFEKATALRPEWMEARHNLGRALYEMGQVPRAYDEFKRCAARPEDGAQLARAMLAVIAPGAPQADNESVFDVRRTWARGLPGGALPARTLDVSRPSNEKLKIGYVSSFFSSAGWMKPVWGLMNRHHRADFEVHLFSDASRAAIRQGYLSHEADYFFDTSRLSNQALAEMIQEKEIQVLVDLNGYSDMKRLPMFMLRPAPVILGWFNMYATTGMPCFDAVIGDGEVIPPEEEAFYSERVERTAHSYLTFSVEYPVPPVAEPPFLNSRQFTFGCLGSQYKITSEVVETWSRILKASPGSRLLLKNKRLNSKASCEFVENLFRDFGVTRERLLLEGPDEHDEFLKAYGRIDVALDTFPYNGGTTTIEAIWQGVPVIAFVGDRWASRTSASILRAGGLGEFVADDLEGYVALAVRLANAPEERGRLAWLRREMRNRLAASHVCDTRGFALEMEEIFRRCWERRLQK